MLYTIQHAQFNAKVSNLGAELKSFKHSAEEYIWQGDEAIWLGSAPILFPMIGRLKNSCYQLDGQSYQMNKHGFARTSTFEVESQSQDRISFKLTATPQTLQQYPFEFVLRVTFSLSDAGLSVDYTVHNAGTVPMYFTIGSHPALRLPIDTGQLSDYFIVFDQDETLDCYQIVDGFLSDSPIEDYLNNEKVIPITADLFKNDALIFKNIASHQVALHHHKTGHRITMHTGQAPHFGLWAKPNAAFVCFEPWYSFDDTASADGKLQNKPGMMQLAQNGTFNTAYQLLLNN